MAIVKAKPTSPGRRGVVQVKHDHLHKGAPHAALLEKKSRTGGRNNAGRITTRHRGGGQKSTIALLTLSATKTVLTVALSVLSMTRTGLRISRWFCMQTVSAVTLSLPKVCVQAIR